ncbi:type IV pilus modification protein PilV [Desulforhopalus sp. IMCC35007]|uniref:type IV pilus modification protein PilV n=1 Tax=Desulforhopalus sp. IMCC35007 TaxID=2569543 RepID=UPI0010ADDFF6|nr:type IV pilus modification protein PilV [Desulforhopalus sp. IMCC35007]TKB09377.1 type IV pilus modification protein PilV [Desulforhopalus sp. IMCC35007]
MKQLKNQKGFTLLEVLIALVILAIGILTVAAMQTTAIRGNATASHMTIANASTTDLFERLLNVSYDDALLTDGVHTDAEIVTVPAFVLPDNVTGITWTVKTGTSTDGVDDDGDTDIDEGDEVGIKFINMTVTYSDGGRNKTRVINFFKHELL